MDWSKHTLVLASSSPSRKLLFEQAKIPFSVKVSGVDETVPITFTPEETVRTLAKRKADAIDRKATDIIVAADSVVSIDNLILGKPQSSEDAKNMLKRLSGRTHNIFSGVCIQFKEQENIFVQATEVTFYSLTDEEIDEYVQTGEPMGKAGSYGIESQGIRLIRSICGDYANIVGIPLAETLRRIEKLVTK
ncbi:Maf family protein [Scatolibacter rhodanostii]|uniref:Maf family protein n=1 Tax=Scatolibacter rhodanostii TaxID=2014781 RepID=UPI000C06A2BB|nr:Maf family protein [Scatolibacter rhodanostii]